MDTIRDIEAIFERPVTNSTLLDLEVTSEILEEIIRDLKNTSTPLNATSNIIERIEELMNRIDLLPKTAGQQPSDYKGM